MTKQNTSPIFTYGRPVQGDQFINRTHELQIVLSRINNGESSAIVGEPHIGKTSFLLRLADTSVSQAFLGDKDVTFNFINLHDIPMSYSPSQFWSEALEPLFERQDIPELTRYFTKAKTSTYDRSEMHSLFRRLSACGKTLVLLMDEFERLLEHPNFKDASFFALLRSLSSTVGGLVIVIASRTSLSALNRRGQELQRLSDTSPLFNTFIQVRLKPFDDEAIEAFFQNCSSAGFSTADILFIRRIAGRHPFLLQGMCASLHNSNHVDRYGGAAENFYEEVKFHFSDLWNSFDSPTQTTATILSILEFGGRSLGNDFSYGEIENVEKFGPNLRKLLDEGLAERIGDRWEFDKEHALLWRGERWTIGSQAFAWWIRDTIIVGGQDIPGVQSWLYNHTYRVFLTQKQWDDLIRLVQKAPDWAVRGVANLARSLFEELIGNKGK